MSRGAIVLVSVLAGCVGDPGFRCRDGAQCGAGGACEATGYCSFADSTCAGGRRYGAHGASLSGRCVGEPGGGGFDLAVPLGCGDGVTDIGEQCDDGPANSDDPGAVTATCTTHCRRRVPCGDLTNSSAASIDPATGHCYVAFPSVADWATAERACQAEGATLAVVTSAAENDAVLALAGATESWIGLTTPPSPPVARDFRWVSGEDAAFTAWAPGEPDNAGQQEECVSLDGAGWHDRPCGRPATGLLPPSPPKTLPYVCEHGCGNQIVEPGEECDPPGPTCTATCKTIRTCDAPAHVSPITGHCYFLYDTRTQVTYGAAALRCRQLGAHVATLDEPAETEAAFAALAAVPAGGVIPVTAWIALTAHGGFGDLAMTAYPAWDANTGEQFDSRRYHDYTAPDPSVLPTAAAPSCTVITLHFMMFSGIDAWRDRACTDNNLVLCERE